MRYWDDKRMELDAGRKVLVGDRWYVPYEGCKEYWWIEQVKSKDEGTLDGASSAADMHGAVEKAAELSGQEQSERQVKD